MRTITLSEILNDAGHDRLMELTDGVLVHSNVPIFEQPSLDPSIGGGPTGYEEVDDQPPKYPPPPAGEPPETSPPAAAPTTPEPETPAAPPPPAEPTPAPEGPAPDAEPDLYSVLTAAAAKREKSKKGGGAEKGKVTPAEEPSPTAIPEPAPAPETPVPDAPVPDAPPTPVGVSSDDSTGPGDEPEPDEDAPPTINTRAAIDAIDRMAEPTPAAGVSERRRPSLIDLLYT